MAQNGPKIKNAQNLSKFGTSNISSKPISILMPKIIFEKYLQPVKNAKDLLKIGKFDISNIPFSILMLKVIFVKYLSPIYRKLVPKLKVQRIS